MAGLKLDLADRLESIFHLSTQWWFKINTENEKKIQRKRVVAHAKRHEHLASKHLQKLFQQNNTRQIDE